MLRGSCTALEWGSLPFILETDNTEAATILNQESINRARDACLVHDIKGLIRTEREMEVKHIRRARTHVSHALTRIGRVNVKIAVWPGRGCKTL